VHQITRRVPQANPCKAHDSPDTLISVIFQCKLSIIWNGGVSSKETGEARRNISITSVNLHNRKHIPAALLCKACTHYDARLHLYDASFRRHNQLLKGNPGDTTGAELGLSAGSAGPRAAAACILQLHWNAHDYARLYALVCSHQAESCTCGRTVCYPSCLERLSQTRGLTSY
jgi:hypothetical protein